MEIAMGHTFCITDKVRLHMDHCPGCIANIRKDDNGQLIYTVIMDDRHYNEGGYMLCRDFEMELVKAAPDGFKPISGFIITDGVEVIDGRVAGGGFVYHSLAWQRTNDAFKSRDCAVEDGDKWGVDWRHWSVREVFSNEEGIWLV
jgi:hypothetical protein